MSDPGFLDDLIVAYIERLQQVKINDIEKIFKLGTQLQEGGPRVYK